MTEPVHRSLREPAANSSYSLGSVVVGIDGSRSARHAARWAVEEAISRDVPIRLVHVIDPAFTEDCDEAMAYARLQLHRVWELLSTHGYEVKIESEIRQGAIAGELVTAAQGAAMLCIGAKGLKHSGRGHGALAREVLASSSVPVGIIRHQHGTDDIAGPRLRRWVMAVLDETASGAIVLQAAIAEAKLRDAPILAMTSWSTTWPSTGRDRDDIRVVVDRYPKDAEEHHSGLQVCALQTPRDLLHLLDDTAGTLMLVVVAADNASRVDELAGPRARKVFRRSGCSLLVVGQ